MNKNKRETERERERKRERKREREHNRKQHIPFLPTQYMYITTEVMYFQSVAMKINS